jgi:type I restriction enzyme S subunit
VRCLQLAPKKHSDRISAALVPDEQILLAFNRSCQPWYDRMVSVRRESRTLSALRDSLLPKPISGELRVNDAERFLANAL